MSRIFIVLLAVYLFASNAYTQTAQDCIRAINALVPSNGGITIQGTDCANAVLASGTTPTLSDIQAWLAANPIKNVIPVATFISRWTTTEYSNLMKARATAINNNSAGMSLVMQWDQAVSNSVVDLNTTAAQNFKSSLVSAGILTQPRADVIFQ